MARGTCRSALEESNHVQEAHRSRRHRCWPDRCSGVRRGGGRPAQITAKVTDSTPASGETFRVAGVLSRDGDALAGKTVKVQTLRNGAWQNISGASMATSSTGKYNLRLVLSQKGERKLRVVGVVAGVDPTKRFTVTVH